MTLSYPPLGKVYKLKTIYVRALCHIVSPRVPYQFSRLLYNPYHLLRFKSLNKHGTTNIKNQNPNKLSQSNNSIIFNNLNVTCQAQPHDLSSIGAFIVC